MTKIAAVKLKTGSDVDAYCSKCDLDLAHVIVAMIGDRPVRVQCKTCRSTHAYRGKKAVDGPTKKSAGAKAGTAKRVSARAAANRANEYEAAMDGKDLARAKRYKPATVFEVDDVIDHPTFRFGVVTRLLSDAKIEVVFETGAKTLVHAREAVAAQ